MIGLVAALFRKAVRKDVPEQKALWYRGQGMDLTECGSKVATMVLFWFGIENFIVASKLGIWSVNELVVLLRSRGANCKLAPNTKIKQLTDRESMIVRINALGVAPHYIFVIQSTDSKYLHISDPLSGIRKQTHDDLMGELIGDSGILITRP